MQLSRGIAERLSHCCFLASRGQRSGVLVLSAGCAGITSEFPKKDEGVKVSNPSVGTAKNVPLVCGNPRFRVQGLAVCQG